MRRDVRRRGNSPGPTKSHGGSLDPRYVASLKEQIQYLELECSLLKQNKNQERKDSPSASGIFTSSSIGLKSSLAEFQEKCRVLEMEHKLELEKRDAERDRLTKELHYARSELEQAINEVKLIQKRAQDIVESHAREMEHKYAVLARKVDKEETAVEQVQALEHQLKLARETLDTERGKWKSEQAEISEKCQTAEADLMFYRNRVEELEGSCGVDRKRLADLEQLASRFDTERQQLEERIARLEASQEQLRAELAQSRNSLAKTQENEQLLFEENRQLVETNATLNENLRQVRHKVAEYASREGEAMQKCTQALTALETQQVQTDTMKNRLANLQARLDTELENRMSIMLQLTSAQTKAEELESKLDAETGKARALQHKLHKTEDHCAKLLAQTASMGTKIDFLEKEGQELKQQVLHARQAQQWAEEKFKELHQKTELQKDLESLSLGEMQRAMQTNLQLATQFDAFLKKHQAALVAEEQD